MNALPRPRRGIAARLLATIFVLPILAAACSGGSPLGGGGGDPAAVVSDALTKVAAQDINGVAALACAGQADAIKSQFDLSGQLGDSLPGVDASALASAVHIDTSGVKVGTPVVNGDAAQVPVTGSMKVTFDTEKIRPIFKQMMEAQGGASMTDAQIDALIDTVAGSGQDVPLNETLDLKKENGAWKICETT